MVISKNCRIVFQGDSVTDCGRDRSDFHSLAGYSAMIGEYFKTFYPELGIELFNRGVSGDRVSDVEARLEADCIELNPDIVTLLVGINDVWRRYDSNLPRSAEEFAAIYRRVLERLASETEAQIVIMEPFIIDADPAKRVYYEDLMPKILELRKLAAEFATDYIPLDSVFARKAMEREPVYYSQDGVHPTQPGNRVIALELLRRATIEE